MKEINWFEEKKGKMKKWTIVSLPGCPSPTDSEVNRNGADDMIIFLSVE